MKEFIAKFGDQINGVLSGFDRLVASVHALVFVAIQVSRWILLDNSRGIV